ncbi:hypothetical protein EUBSIR_00739 [[Eubacterium] siraeum DSM 15702]|uniref:Uncharacterized protein n=1 Tax=[Eubacterium] siraeum DSM 15702 TaxID=428128 RepID=B0MLN6_9FIRM|nr:hypothetical protein EUBSIR_00739 [[Eubacterium] siraeum DSM 15702]
MNQHGCCNCLPAESSGHLMPTVWAVRIGLLFVLYTEKYSAEKQQTCIAIIRRKER